MAQILLKSAGFIFIIILGYCLKRCGFFSPRDYAIPMKLVLNVTLPAAVITSFASYTPDLSLLLCTVLGLGLNWVQLGTACLLSRGKERPSRAVWLNSVPGYNIGAFALPFVQSFLSPASVVACCLFDSGGALMSTGGTYAVSCAIMKDPDGMSLKAIGKKLLSSRPFMTYVIMLVLTMAGISIPQAVVIFISPIANANAFLAMMMIGMMFDLKLEKRVLKDVAGMVAVRMTIAVLASLACYFLLPFDLEIRQAMAIVVFAPVGVACTALTETAGGDPAEAACLNSICMVISIVCIVTLLALFGVL